MSQCSVSEYCQFSEEQTCKMSKNMLENMGLKNPSVKNCTISCLPKPLKKIFSTDTPTCDVCMESGELKTECVKQKCQPGLTMCRNVAYTIKSKNLSSPITASVKGCAAPTECEVDRKEMAEFIRAQSAQALPDVFISDFSMHCSNSNKDKIPKLVLSISTIVVSFLGILFK